jgi:uncharacterized protein with NAD-binding domain and iron-sulfur cluster
MNNHTPIKHQARVRPSKRHVAILGSGPAGLAAAFALSRTKALRALYDVTIYQAGWRAGGKSATGRAMNKGWRIEQNGSHYLFGCYGNSFAMVHEAYEVLRKHRDAGFGTYREQFVPRTLIVAKNVDDPPWSIYIPETLEWPHEGTLFPRPSHYALMGFQWAGFFFFWTILRVGDKTKAAPRAAAVMMTLCPLSPLNAGAWAAIARSLATAFALLIDCVLVPALYVFRILRAALGGLLVWLNLDSGPTRSSRRTTSLESKLIISFCKFLRRVVNHEPFRRLQRMRRLLDLGTSTVIGYCRDQLWEPGNYESIDGKDFSDWLREHGASKDSLRSSLVKSWYDSVVAYVAGKDDDRSISAPISLHALSRAFLSYKGAVTYQMGHEIGDAFIGPIAKALQWRGVKFKYFHRVIDIKFDKPRGVVTEVEMELQGTDAGRAAYEQGTSVEKHASDMRKICLPFVPMPLNPTRAVWPNQPVFDPSASLKDLEALPDPPLTQSDSELFPVDGTRHTIRLAEGPEADADEFHEVVYALPLDSTRDFEALSKQPEWGEALARVQSAISQSMRLWGSKSLKELGWDGASPILSGFADPYSTWEDNAQNVGHECFGDASPPLPEPEMIGTLFGPFAKPAGLESDLPPYPRGTGPNIHEKYLAYTREVARDFYAQYARQLWPNIGKDPFSPLITDSPVTGPRRFDWQYVSVNIGCWARYVLALPGTLANRIRPDETGFRNMVAAGEWTHNGFEVGCVEGAVMSGLIAARAISDSTAPVLSEEEMTFGSLTSTTVSLPRPGPA